jgi:serine protease
VSFATRNARSRLLVAAIACAFALPVAARPGEDGYDRFIVKFKSGSTELRSATARQRVFNVAARDRGVQMREQRHLAAGAELVRTSHKLNYAAAQQLMQRLKNNPNVEYVTLDTRKKAAFTPNDTYYAAYQWHYTDATSGIGAPAAWDIAQGDGIVVAVIDTGITAHPDLDANIVAGYDFISDTATAGDGGGRDADPSDPGDFVAADECGAGEPAADSSWHGTHVAGTVAAVTNNSAGMAGVAFDAKVQPLRVLGKCGGWTSDIADAIIWASGGTVSGVSANATPAEVINMSLGGGGSCDPLSQAAIDIAVANGSVVVVAAGNENDAVANHSPASCNNVVSVGAIASDGTRSSFSNYGPLVDVSAPGGGGTAHGPSDHTPYIWSTLNDGATAPGAPVYSGYQGTSMASPHVAGVAALMQSHDVRTPALVETVLKGTTRAFGAGDCDTGAGTCGTGLLDAPGALAALDSAFLYIDDATAVLEGNSGTKTVTFTVRLSETVGTPVTFSFATASGTATSGTDFVASSLTNQTIPAGQLSKTISVTINGDTTTEADETFVANVSSVVGATALDTQATATIVNDEAVALTNGVPLTGQSAALNVDKLYKIDVPAGATNLVIATSGGGAGEDVDLYVKANMSPTQGSDCASESPTAAETCTIASPVAGTYYILLKAYTAYSGVTISASYTAPPTIAGTLSINDVGLVEGDAGTKTMTFTVTLSQTEAVPVTFDIASANGTATAGSDYTAINLTSQSIPAGQLSKTFNVDITGETTVEWNETLFLNITNANANVTDAQGRGMILNNDGPVLSITDTSTGEGNAGTKVMTFTVKLSQAAAVPVTYSVQTVNGTALSSSDYVASSLTNQTIPAGQLSKTFSVTLNGDAVVEPNENLQAVLTTGTVSIIDGLAVGTVLNDDGPVLSIADNGVLEGNSGTKILSFTVTLSQVSASPVTFNIATAASAATAGEDYTGFSLTNQSIPAGELTKTFNVTVNGDTTVEGNEFFFVNLSNASVSLFDSQARGNILNDDGTTMRILDASVTEGNSGTKLLTFTVQLNQAHAGPVNYDISTSNGTAAAGSDYVASTLVGQSIPAGQVAKTFSVTINGDSTVEADETLVVTLSNNTVSATDGQAIGTITNDD